MISSLLNSRSGALSLDAIDDLYSKQAQELWAIFYARCSDHAVADDVLSESFTRLLAHRDREIRNPRAWLIHFGTNLVIDHVRREKRYHKRTGCADQPTSRNSPDEHLLLTEVRHIVRECLYELSPGDRLVLVLRYGLGHSTRRICGVIGRSVAAVDMQLSRARRRLAAALCKRGIRQPGDFSMKSPREHSGLRPETAPPEESQSTSRR